jgi:hypothetical protein
MKLNPWYLAALVPTAIVVAGQWQYAAPVAVLGMTLGIFFGTLTLRRPIEGDATSTNPGI